MAPQSILVSWVVVRVGEYTGGKGWVANVRRQRDRETAAVCCSGSLMPRVIEGSQHGWEKPGEMESNCTSWEVVAPYTPQPLTTNVHSWLTLVPWILSAQQHSHSHDHMSGSCGSWSLLRWWLCPCLLLCPWSLSSAWSICPVSPLTPFRPPFT